MAKQLTLGVISTFLLLLSACGGSPSSTSDSGNQMAAGSGSPAMEMAAMDPKAGFTGMQEVITKTTSAVTAGDVVQAKAEFEQFETYWSKVEDGVKAKAPQTYKTIEEGMDNVEIALKTKPADQTKTLASLTALNKTLESYAATL